jgi:hypothetical protein
MRPSFVHAALAAALYPHLAIAQGVTATATAASVSGAVQVGTAPPIVRQVPAGTPLAASSVILVSTGVPGLAVAVSNGNLQVADTGVVLTVNQSLVANNQATASVQADLLLDVNLPASGNVRVELEVRGTIRTGTPMPLISADIGNDGSFELGGTLNRTVSIPRVFAGTTRILLRATGSMSGTPGQLQQSSLAAILRVVPDAPTITVQPLLASCGSGALLTVEETFGRGVQLRTSLPARAPAFLVAGLSATFTPVPGLANCFLAPSPDIVTPATTAPVVLPASVAPLQFYVQAVGLSNPTPTLFFPFASNSALISML